MNGYKNKFGFTIYCIHIYVISLNTVNRLRKGRIRNQNRRKHYPPLKTIKGVMLKWLPG